MEPTDLNVDINALLARLSARLGQASQTIEIQQLQIEKLQRVIADNAAASEVKEAAPDVPIL
jgi:FtsZ-binding cell division protein ZapB